jgi:hypothetical protein
LTIIENKTPNLWYAVLKGIHECTAVGERGVARQYSVTAGRVENRQVGVFVAYASRFDQTLIDRRLYLPEAWANDTERRRGAAVPETVAFQTKPAIAAQMLAAALDAGEPCAFVLATRSNYTLRLLTSGGLEQTDPLLADALPPDAWMQHAAGEGSKGPRLYDWPRIALPWTDNTGFERGTRQPRKLYPDLAEQRRDPTRTPTLRVVPPTARLTVWANIAWWRACAATARSNLRQQELRFGQCQTQIGDLTKTIRPADRHHVETPGPSIPVPTKRSVHSIQESPAGSIPDRSYCSVHDPPINGRSRGAAAKPCVFLPYPGGVGATSSFAPKLPRRAMRDL